MSIISGGTGISKAAFTSDKLWCPFCNGTRWSFVETITATRYRYRCKDCHKTVQYDFSANMGHPYEVFGKGKYRQIVDALKDGKSPQEILQQLRRSPQGT